jgi:hypothetical protein
VDFQVRENPKFINWKMVDYAYKIHKWKAMGLKMDQLQLQILSCMLTIIILYNNHG